MATPNDPANDQPNANERLLENISKHEQVSLDDLNSVYLRYTLSTSKYAKCANCFYFIFYLCCVVTGEYFYNPKSNVSGAQESGSSAQTEDDRIEKVKKCSYLSIFAIFCCAGNIIIIIYAIGFDLTAVIGCYFNNESCGFIYDFPDRNISNMWNSSTTEKDHLLHAANWHKVVIITSSIAGTLSYIFMTCALYGRYTCLSSIEKCVCCYRGTDLISCCVDHSCCEPLQHKLDRLSDKPNILVVNPFNNESYDMYSELRTDTQYVSSLLTPKQCVYFNVFFWFSLLVYTVSVGSYVFIMRHEIIDRDHVHVNNTYQYEWLELTGLIAQFVSQFCALISCFIFSKVAYAVSNRCLDYSKFVFLLTNTSDEGENRLKLVELRDDLRLTNNITGTKKVDHLSLLKAMDQRYIQLLRNSLYPFSAWFAIHWILHTLTAFMALAYIVDEVTMKLYGPPNCDWDSLYCALKLVHSISFALFHCILFLYPCFRAASVTKARQAMIKSVSRARWEHVKEQKQAFETYLKVQNASFKIDILCARLTFGFELAFLSIVVGVFGVVMKLALS